MENQIRKIRLEKGMMQKELAERAQISAPYLVDIEKNRRKARRETLARIAAALEVPVENLMDDQKVG